MSSDVKTVKITKIDSTSPPPKPAPTEAGTRKHSLPAHHHKQPKHGVLKGGKTARAKIHGVRDPAKPPPTNKATLKILTEKGVEKRRKNIRKTVRAMSDQKARQILQKSGLPISQKTPPELVKQILEGGMEAGMIVSG